MPMIAHTASLELLDDARLNKQVLEASQIIEIIMDPTKGYQNHPAVRMWRGHVLALCNYGAIAAKVWTDRRGTAPERQATFALLQRAVREVVGTTGGENPPWVGCIDYHESHRSNLIRKSVPLYGGLWPNTPEDMPYLWPVSEGYSNGGFALYVSENDYKRLDTGERVLPDYLRIETEGKLRRVYDAV